MGCEECTQAATRKHSGTYNAKCVQCCARVVVSARPFKHHQESMIEALIRFEGAPSRVEILNRVKNA